jgi:hypothetical protein
MWKQKHQSKDNGVDPDPNPTLTLPLTLIKLINLSNSSDKNPKIL